MQDTHRVFLGGVLCGVTMILVVINSLSSSSNTTPMDREASILRDVTLVKRQPSANVSLPEPTYETDNGDDNHKDKGGLTESILRYVALVKRQLSTNVLLPEPTHETANGDDNHEDKGGVTGNILRDVTLVKQQLSTNASLSEPTHETDNGDDNHEDKWVVLAKLPDWFSTSWARSATHGLSSFVGSKPLFPPCSDQPPSKGMYHFVEPHKYLKSIKGPCWYQQPNVRRGLTCVPYFYLAGVSKCGTTDMARRLRKHPDISQGQTKEFHWWDRHRYKEDGQSVIDAREGAWPFSKYTSYLDNDADKKARKDDLRKKGYSNHISGDYSPSYLWDRRYWHLLAGNQGCLEPRVVIAQHIRHVYPRAKIILTFRHPTPRAYSRFIASIAKDDVPESERSPEGFHRLMVKAIGEFRECFARWSIRHCTYNDTLTRGRLMEGMYPVLVADWLRVWPRDQLLLLRYEDYGGHEQETIDKITDFLGLARMTASVRQLILELPVANSKAAVYKKYGHMLAETKQMMDEFYQPFIETFASMLNDDRFLWKGVYNSSASN